MDDVLKVIAEEAQARRTVLIRAREKDGSIESREIEPYSIRPGKEEERLMFFCLERNAMRSILLPNLLFAEPTGRDFVPRYDVEL